MKIYLDLLPKHRKKELKRKKIFREILREEFLFILPVVLFIVILMNVYYLLSIERDSSLAAKSRVESEDKYQKLGLYEEKFKQVNESSAKLLKLQAGHLHWEEIFNKLNAAVPNEIAITNFSTKDFKVFLVGEARNRDILLTFKDKLEKDDCFADINVPISNLVVKDDIDFQIDFSIKPECLRR